MRTDKTASALIFFLVLAVFIFTLSSLAQVEPESPDVWPVYGGATYTAVPTAQPAVLTLLATQTFLPRVPTRTPTPDLFNDPVFPQAMTSTLKPVIIPRWP